MTIGTPPQELSTRGRELDDASEPLSIVLEFTRTENPQDPHAFRFVPQSYTLRVQGGSPELLVLDWSPALLGDLRALARPGCDAELAQRIGDALRSTLIRTSWRSLGREIAAAADAGRRVLVNLRSNAAELYALPWEQLTVDASGRRISELQGVVLRYEWPDTKTRAAEPAPRPAGGRALMAWSAAGGAVPNAEHLRAIKDAYRDGHLSFDEERDQLAHASLDALVRKLARASQDGEPYAILHLLCHGEAVGSSYGLALSDEREKRAVIDAAALRRALAPYAKTLRLVVLAACNTGRAGELDGHLGSVAQSLHRVGFAAVVASRSPLSVDGSIALTQRLYRALAVELSSLEGAFAAARSEMGLHDAASLQLFARAADGDDSRPIVFRPYRGLLAFTAADRRFFCGRDREIAELVARVEAARGGALPRFQLVVGPSGVGKSSLVLGGLLPALSPDAGDSVGHAWTCAAFRLGGGLRALWGVLHDLRGGALQPPALGPPAVNSPAEVMEEAHALRADDPGGSLLLVIDQFEELFSPSASATEGEALTRTLWRLAGRRELGIVVVATLRADYVGHGRSIILGDDGADLATLATDERYASTLSQIDDERLAEIVERPGAKVGLRFHGGLIARILGELEGAVEALPLLAVTLDELWLRRDGNTLTLAAFEALEGLRGGVRRAAERVIEAMTPAERTQARRVLVRAMKPGLRGGDASRERVDTDLLRPRREAEAEHFDRAIAAMVRERLLVAGDADLEDTTRGAWIEVAHEALIRHWPRLLEWEREDRPRLQRMRAWQERCSAWVAAERSQDKLLGRGELTSANAELDEARRLGDLDVDLEDYLDRSAQAQARRRDRQRRTALLASAVLTLVTGLFVTLTVVAVRAQREAKASERRALRNERRAKTDRWRAEFEALRARDATRMQLVSEQRRDPTGRVALLREVECPQRAVGYLAAAAAAVKSPVSDTIVDMGAAIVAAAVSPDGAQIVTASRDGAVQLWSTEGALIRALSGNREVVTSVAFNAEGTHLAAGSEDPCAYVWRLDGEEAPHVLCGHLGEVVEVALSPDGERLLTVSGGERKARLWRVRAPSLLRELDGHRRNVRAAAFAPGGDLILTVAGKEALLWPEDDDSRRIAAHDRAIQAAALSPDGERLATADADGVVRTWLFGQVNDADDADDRAEPAPIGEWSTSANATSLVWSPDGRIAVTAAAAAFIISPSSDVAVTQVAHAGADPEHYRVVDAVWSAEGGRLLMRDDQGGARVFDVDGGGPPQLLLGHTQGLTSANFLSDGRIATTAEDGALRLWSTPRTDRPSTIVGHSDPLMDAAWVDDETLLSGSRDRDARIWSLRGGEPQVLAHDGVVLSVAVDGDSGRLLTTSEDGTARLWDRRGAPLPGSPLVHDHGVTRGLFVPQSADVITIAKDHRVRRWRLAEPGTSEVLCTHDKLIRDAAVSPDGAWVATASADGTAKLCALRGSPRERTLYGHRGDVYTVAWSPDSARLVTGSKDRSARLWDVAGDAPPIQLRGHAQAVSGVAFSPRGDRLLTAADDGSARVWSLDGATLRELRDGPPAAARSAVWSLNGSTVAIGGADGRVRLWAVDEVDAPVVFDEGEDATIVAFSPSGDRVLGAGESGDLRVWPTPSLGRLTRELAESPAACLSERDRVALLGEPAEVAAARVAGCRERGSAPLAEPPIPGLPPLCPRAE